MSLLKRLESVFAESSKEEVDALDWSALRAAATAVHSDPPEPEKKLLSEVVFVDGRDPGLCDVEIPLELSVKVVEFQEMKGMTLALVSPYFNNSLLDAKTIHRTLYNRVCAVLVPVKDPSLHDVVHAAKNLKHCIDDITSSTRTMNYNEFIEDALSFIMDADKEGRVCTAGHYMRPDTGTWHSRKFKCATCDNSSQSYYSCNECDYEVCSSCMPSVGSKRPRPSTC